MLISQSISSNEVSFDFRLLTNSVWESLQIILGKQRIRLREDLRHNAEHLCQILHSLVIWVFRYFFELPYFRWQGQHSRASCLRHQP